MPLHPLLVHPNNTTHEYSHAAAEHMLLRVVIAYYAEVQTPEWQG